MRTMRRILCVLGAAALLAACPALAEDELEDFSLLDLVDDLEYEETYDSVSWDFPVRLSDLDPELIRLANKQVLLPKDYVPENLVKVIEGDPMGTFVHP